MNYYAYIFLRRALRRSLFRLRLPPRRPENSLTTTISAATSVIISPPLNIRLSITDTILSSAIIRLRQSAYRSIAAVLEKAASGMPPPPPARTRHAGL